MRRYSETESLDKQERQCLAMPIKYFHCEIQHKFKTFVRLPIIGLSKGRTLCIASLQALYLSEMDVSPQDEQPIMQNTLEEFEFYPCWQRALVCRQLSWAGVLLPTPARQHRPPMPYQRLLRAEQVLPRPGLKLCLIFLKYHASSGSFLKDQQGPL